jgi:WD40 repeat protein
VRLAIKSAQAAADAAAEAELTLHAAEQSRQQAEAALAAAKAAADAAEKPVRAVSFSPDGVTLAAAGDDGVVHTYGADTGAEWETFHGQAAPLTAVAFAGPAVLAGAADGAVTGFDPAPQWTRQSQLGGDASSPFVDRVTALDFSPDGKLLAAGGGMPSREGEVTLWEVDGGKLVRKFDQPHSDAVLALDFSPDGRLLATAGADRFMKVSDVATGRPIKSFEGHAGHVLGVSFQHTGRTLVTASADNTVKVWDAVGGEQRKGVTGFDKEVTAVRFVGDTDQFVAAAGDGRVRLLRPDGGEVRSFGGASGFVYAVDVTRDGAMVVAGGEDGTLRAWTVSDGKPLITLPPPAATAAVARP